MVKNVISVCINFEFPLFLPSVLLLFKNFVNFKYLVEILLNYSKERGVENFIRF